MSKTSLSDRLKNVEDEINEITSLMSLKGSASKFSLSRSLSDSTMTDKSTSKSLILSSSSTSIKPTTNPTRNLSELSQNRCTKTLDIKRNHSRSQSRSQCRILSHSSSDTKLKSGYASSKSSSDTLSNSQTVVNVNGSGEIEVHHLVIPKPNLLSKSAIGDTLKMNQNVNLMNPATTSYDSIQTFLHTINNSIIEGNQVAMSKLMDDCPEAMDCSELSLCGNGNVLSSHVAQYQNLMKEIGLEQDKRIKVEMALEELKVELTKCKEDVEIQRELAQKYRELSEQFEADNRKQLEVLKACERTNEEREMELELCKQKYESVLKDLKMEQEHTWILERDIRQMKDCLDKSQLKMQELLGARTMAVELAHDLQKKHQSYVVDYQNELMDMKNKNCELEKLLNESIREKNCVVERLQSLEDCSKKCKKLQSELNEYEKNMADAEKTICELTRNPEGIPQVRHILSSQEQTFKAALTEKATSEMALQAKYTTLEVELQLIQDEFNKRLQEFEEEKNRLVVEAEKKSMQQAAEIDRLKLVTEELTELSNQYKSRISELSDVNKHQEVLIKCQNEAISSKEERNKLNMQEADLNLQRVEQEKKSLILEHEKSINNLKKLLEEESDKLRVKDKIADDQTETIMQLKTNLSDKSKEVQRKIKEIQRLEQILKQEKMEKENLNCDVQHLKMHRIRLNDTIADLQKQVEASKSNNIHKKHSQMLEELEKKVAEKQAEWEEEISKLRTERDQARESAQYAIENLSCAIQEHQKEVNNQKELQTRLAGIIKEKEEQLNIAENKVMRLEREKDLFTYGTMIDKRRYFMLGRTAPMT